METKQLSIAASGIAQLAYGVDLQDTGNFKSNLAFNDYDLWFGNDFDHLMNTWLEDLLDEIESDITSVDSTNLSEQRSEQRSAQSSADRAAMIAAGLLSSDATSLTSDSKANLRESSYVSTPSSSDSNNGSATSSMTSESEVTTPDHVHSQHHGGYDENSESVYSGLSWSDEDQSGFSDSEGTSQATGEASTLSSVSFTIEQYNNIYADNDSSASIHILDDDRSDSLFEDKEDEKLHSGKATEAKHFPSSITGIEWVGDDDHEKIFGTSWLDILQGKDGNDSIYGLEGADYITGGDGIDQLMGGAGDDVIYTSYGENEAGTIVTGHGDFASGGSGNDKIYGDKFNETIFGGEGHDTVRAGRGNDHVDGGAGDDFISAGQGTDTVYGGDGDDNIQGGNGRDTLHGGDGDDTVRGENGDDDIYGGAGNDRLFGGRGNDDIWAGDGDDYVKGSRGSEIIRGEAGDDILLGGRDDNGKPNIRDDYEYIYGGDGDDAIFGQDGIKKEYLLGGAGDDYMRGGHRIDELKMWGGDGDDFIRPSNNKLVKATGSGGKGDDIINFTEYNDSRGKFGFYRRYDHDNGIRLAGVDEDWISRYGDSGNAAEEWHGDQGDDMIWAGGLVKGDILVTGGTGDDSIYGGYKTVGDTNLYGGSGKDLIRTDWFRVNGEDDAENTGNEYIWGDYKYGEDALDKDLWGDDDIIYGGYGDRDHKQKIYGGDGDDEIHGGDNWKRSRMEGQGGNDTFFVPQKTKKSIRVIGGEGDDVWEVLPYGDVPKADRNGAESGFGGAGNDIVRGTHRAKEQYLYGGAGNDKVYGGDGVTTNGKYQVMSGGAGDDWMEGGDNLKSDQYMYGDNIPPENCDFPHAFESAGIEGYGLEQQYITEFGDDVMYGGENIEGDQYLFGGAGDDRVTMGHNTQGDYVKAWGDSDQAASDPYDLPDGSTWSKFRGAPGDGDDIIHMGDHPDIVKYVVAYGNGGNDKIVGGVGQGEERLYGGDDDDKIWANAPGRSETESGSNYLYGGNGNDIIYGSTMDDQIFGDWNTTAEDTDVINEFDTEGGDDIIYTGEATEAAGGSLVSGGWGNDKIYGQGLGTNFLYGDFGDDKIWGGDGTDYIWGDDAAGQTSGDDTLYGGDGTDFVYGGAGNDYVSGGDGDDYLDGDSGEDTIWGGDGDDYIDTGTGWDTVFGGDGCDSIVAFDGGDVLWGGDCEDGDQIFSIYGTGQDPENYTVIMDFWHETAMPFNQICMYPDIQQGAPGSGACVPADDTTCMTATDILSGRGPTGTPPTRTRGSGCKNDGGPLWISIDFADEETGITNVAGTGDAYRTVYGRIFQKKSSHVSRSRRSRRSRYAQTNSYPTETKSDLVECMALHLCTATASGPVPAQSAFLNNALAFIVER